MLLAGALAEASIPSLLLTTPSSPTSPQGPQTSARLLSRTTDLPALLLSAIPGSSLADDSGRVRIAVSASNLIVTGNDDELLTAISRAAATSPR